MELILGGARSGKSNLAEARAMAWASRHQARLVYVATAAAGDSEMAGRIAEHQRRRRNAWQTREVHLHLARELNALIDASGPVAETSADKNCADNRSDDKPQPQCILVDCLTLWISNCLHAGNWMRERDALLAAVARLAEANIPVHLILVSNEVGSGIVPLGQLSRDFVDASGWLHQALAGIANEVTLVVAGLPLSLKSTRATPE